MRISHKADAAEARIHETRDFMQRARVAARRKYTSEEKGNKGVEVEPSLLKPKPCCAKL